METLKHKRGKMQVVKKLLLVVLTILLSNCYSQKTNKTEKDYIITKYTSKDKFSCYLNLEAFEYEDNAKRSYSVYHVNNLVFSNHGIKALNLNVLKGSFKIKAGDITKNWIDLSKIILKKGDSISIRFYLKDLNEVYE